MGPARLSLFELNPQLRNSFLLRSEYPSCSVDVLKDGVIFFRELLKLRPFEEKLMAIG